MGRMIGKALLGVLLPLALGAGDNARGAPLAACCGPGCCLAASRAAMLVGDWMCTLRCATAACMAACTTFCRAPGGDRQLACPDFSRRTVLEGHMMSMSGTWPDSTSCV